MKQKNTRCVIISGGKIDDYAFMKTFFDQQDFIICADSGISHAMKLGITPMLCLGDFDSFKEPIAFDCEIIRYPSEKDDTDTAAAAKEAIKRGFTEVLIIGGTGGRLDHTIANLQVLKYLHVRNIKAQMADEHSVSQIYSAGNYNIVKKQGYNLSLFSYDNSCIIKNLTGVKYPLKDALLTNEFPLGISNEFVEDDAQLSFKNGDLLIILSKD